MMVFQTDTPRSNVKLKLPEIARNCLVLLPDGHSSGTAACQWNEIRREAGLPDGTIRAQVGHISAQVMKRYSHIRRQELNGAAAALEPKFLKSVLVI
jgi:hypothetical protein